MHKILKSLIPTEEALESFQRLCNAQIEEMRAHDKHMKNVEEDPENYHPYPAPFAHPDIMAAIVKDGDDYNIEFEYIDDVTPPPPLPLTLSEKKHQLSNALTQEAAVLQEAIIPTLKRPLRDIRYTEIVAIPKEDRTDEQNRIFDKFNADIDAMKEIHKHVAVMQDEIDDLTDKNIDKWKPKPFPGAKR